MSRDAGRGQNCIFQLPLAGFHDSQSAERRSRKRVSCMPIFRGHRPPYRLSSASAGAAGSPPPMEKARRTGAGNTAWRRRPRKECRNEGFFVPEVTPDWPCWHNCLTLR